jgi:hypothetical protein
LANNTSQPNIGEQIEVFKAFGPIVEFDLNYNNLIKKIHQISSFCYKMKSLFNNQYRINRYNIEDQLAELIKVDTKKIVY